MSIAVTVQGRALADVVRAWATATIDRDVRRATVDDDCDTLPRFWDALASQGFLGVHVDATRGGGGAGMAELAIVVEELGRVLAPGPVVSTMLASAILAAAGHDVASLVDGSRPAAVGLGSGSLTLAGAGRAATLSGTSDWIVGGHTADLFVVPAASDAGTVWVSVDRGAVEVDDAASHDVTRGQSRVTARAVPVDVLDVEAQLPRDLAAVVVAAESSGIADWAVTTAAAHARVREQFGRPIGQFQGVKHRCARMLAAAHQARACAWDAANVRDLDVGADEASLAAAVAAAVAPTVALDNVKACIQTLGGIGYTWEHDAHLYLRRALVNRMMLGETEQWQQRVADLTLSGARRRPSIELPPSADQVRTRVKAELAEVRQMPEGERRIALADAGYTAPHFPKPWGRGADAVEQLVIAEELAAAELQPHDMIIGSWVLPTLIEAGRQDQLERFMPPTLRGEIIWCQLFSEPEAGSDLAALTTRATRVEGGWSLSGQKIWTSMARQADWAVVLARTNRDAPKHRGISYFVLDMTAPGIDIRPIRDITGEATFNEVFLDEVFVPDEMLVGEVDEGWELVRTTLANERVSISSVTVGHADEALVQLAGHLDLDAGQQAALGQLLSTAQSRAMLSLRTTIRSMSNMQPGPESSVAKLIGTVHAQQTWETVVRWRGLDALVETSDSWSPTQAHLNSQCLTIAGGTTDVLLNIIGERMLGLPRDPLPPETSPTPRSQSSEPPQSSDAPNPSGVARAH